MTEQTLYFTFSTIAQCVAISFMLLGIFVLFRLQITDTILKELAHHLVAITTRARISTEIPGLIAARKYERAYEHLCVPGNPSETLQTNHAALMAELLDAIQLRTQFRKLITPSIGLIGVSILALSLADYFATSQLFSMLVVALLLGWLARILMMMATLIRGCFNH